jgi:hypothetical protein
MVLRGGFGLTFFPTTYDETAMMKNAPYNFSYGCGEAPFASTPCAGQFASETSGRALLAAGLPAPSIDLSTANPENYGDQAIAADDIHGRNSYIEQLSLQMQKELGGNLLTIGYLGNLGRDLAFHGNINQPSCASCNYQIPSLPGANISPVASQGTSEYHALEATFVRRLRNGLTFTANYTWSHLIDNAGSYTEGEEGSMECIIGPCPVDNLANAAAPKFTKGWQQYDWGNGDLDIRHRVTGMLDYKLPFGKSSNHLFDKLVRDWAVNLATGWQTGQPFTVLNAIAVSGVPGLMADRPDVIGSANLSHRSPTEWFNTSAFQMQTANTFGNERRNQYYGPHLGKADISLSREIAFFEAMRLQLRAESFNFTNSPGLSYPNDTIFGYDSNGVATSAGSFGAITATSLNAAPRELQFALKLIF